MYCSTAAPRPNPRGTCPPPCPLLLLQRRINASDGDVEEEMRALGEDRVMKLTEAEVYQVGVGEEGMLRRVAGTGGC